MFSRGAAHKTVTVKEYGPNWPLTVDSAKLCCKYPAVWVEVNGRKYWLNGSAEATIASIRTYLS